MTTYYVANAGSDGAAGTSPATAWQTLNKLDIVKGTFLPGDSILLNRGDTWNVSPLFMNDQSGSAGNPITYGAYGTGALPIISAAGARTYAVFFNNCQYLTLQDVQVTGATLYGIYMIADTGDVKHINVTGVTSYSNTHHGFYIEHGTPVADDITYTSCTADRNGYGGFVVFQLKSLTTGITYDKCVATYSGQGIAYHGFSAYDSDHITYNECEAAYTNIDPGTGLPNAFTGEGIGLTFDDFTASSQMTHCYAHGNAGPGIQSSHQGANTTIFGCLAVNNLAAGIYANGAAGGSTNIKIYNNTIANNAVYGIDCTPGNIVGIEIKNNIIANNTGYGIAFHATTVTSYTVATNVLYGNTIAPTVNVSGATGTISTDPFFTNPASNFALRSNSPAIDAGLDLGATYKYILNPSSIWPSNVALIDQTTSLWEIGAYAFLSAATADPFIFGSAL